MTEQVVIPDFKRVRNGKEHAVPGYTRRKPNPRWTKAKIIEAIRLWNDLYGEPPRCADWNPSMARMLKKRRNVDHRTGLYVSGNWPSAATVQRTYGGFAAAIRAAGLKPHPTGPRRRKAADDVLRQVTEEEEMTPVIVLSRTKAVVEAYRERDLALLRGSLTDLAAAALAWREHLDNVIPPTGQFLGEMSASDRRA